MLDRKPVDGGKRGASDRVVPPSTKGQIVDRPRGNLARSIHVSGICQAATHHQTLIWSQRYEIGSDLSPFDDPFGAVPDQSDARRRGDMESGALFCGIIIKKYMT